MPHVVASTNYNKEFSDALSTLNEEQLKAVQTIEGPVLVIAGPGTGKTQIIAARIGYILSTRDAQAHAGNILCLTYTDAGAIAMRQRLLRFIGPVAYRVHIQTFHAFCNEVIQSNLDFFGRRYLEPITDLEKVTLIREIIDGLAVTHPLKRLRGDAYSDLNRLENLFQMMKQEDWSPDFVRTKCDEYMKILPERDEYIYKRANAAKGIKAGDLKKELIVKQEEKMSKLIAAADLFPYYQERMQQMHRYDYADMILWVIDAFKKDENLLRNYQERFQYFLVDEFQDTSGAQNEILNLLTDFWPNPNVFCVGDDDQCIYEFQQARIENMKEFVRKHCESLTTIILTNNYRSTQSILDASKHVIDLNTKRLTGRDAELKQCGVDVEKTLTAALQPMKQSAVKPKVVEYPNIAQEEAAVVLRIEELQQQGIPLKEIAVIYYRHAQGENIIRLLHKKGIAYRVKKRIDILGLPLVGNILKLFEFISEESKQPFSGEHLLFEILHFKFLGVDPHDVIRIAVESEKKKMNWREWMSNEMLVHTADLKNPKRIAEIGKLLNEWISDSSNLTLQILFEKVMNESGLLRYAVQNDERVFLLQVIHTLFDFLKAENTKEPRMKISEWLEMIEQMESHGIGLALEQMTYKEDGVYFTTCHSAKGLEFQYVFLLGCTSDKWESRKGGNFNFSLPDTLTHAGEENDVESTRRLFYVAMTRAKEHLMISYAARNAEDKELEPSQFIAESQLPVERVNLDEETVMEMLGLSMQQVAPPVIELFDEEYVTKSLENFSVSASALNAYLDCPLRFYFEYILPLPAAKNDSMAFGSCIHEALYNLFDRMKKRGDKFPSKDELIADFELLMQQNVVSFTEKQFSNRLALGRQMLSDYYDEYIDEWNKIVVLEYPVRHIEVDGVPVNGKLDKIEFTGNNVKVIDYKTGKPKYGLKNLRPPASFAPEDSAPRNRDEHALKYGGDYWRQLVFYKILMDHQRRKNWNMTEGVIDFLEKDESGNFVRKEVKPSHDDIRFVRDLITSTYRKILNHEFRVGCGKEDCEWCAFVREHFEGPVPAIGN